MAEWSSGYVADIGYTFGYYDELNLQRAKLALLYKGHVVPEIKTACELGFGQGLSVNIHAAASATEWFATDFNPSQASYAQELSKISQSGARLFDDAFSEFISRDDLPDFDYIGVHGIWSWISDENRAVIVDFIRRKLKVGGVLYISYNTFPGWAPFAPMRHLLTQHAEKISASGTGIISRIEESIQFAGNLLAANPLYAQVNPQIKERLDKLKAFDRKYLAHEYFNRDWRPMHFSQIAELLEPAKVQFACSAHLHDHVDQMSLTTEMADFLNELPDLMFRESVRDFMVNQQFRRDFWVKGLRPLSPLKKVELLREQRFMLLKPASDISLKVTTIGEVQLNESVYSPILASLEGGKIKSIGQLEKELAGTSVNIAALVQSLLVLCGKGDAAIVQDDAVIAKAKKTTERLNAHLIEQARDSADVSYLASPVTGSGIQINRFQQLFIGAAKLGKRQPSELAQYVWFWLSMQGQKIVNDGKVIESEAENLAELNAQAQEFLDKKLPILKALQIV